jgi:ABC-type transport system involved in cytochrome c biogenesis ATPase subunit
VVVSRPPREARRAEALELLAQRGEVLCYDKLHTKAVAGVSVVVTSANLVKTSLLRNIETGVYYRETPTALRLHLEEVAASGRPCRSP